MDTGVGDSSGGGCRRRQAAQHVVSQQQQRTAGRSEARRWADRLTAAATDCRAGRGTTLGRSSHSSRSVAVEAGRGGAEQICDLHSSGDGRVGRRSAGQICYPSSPVGDYAGRSADGEQLTKQQQHRRGSADGGQWSRLAVHPLMQQVHLGRAGGRSQ